MNKMFMKNLEALGQYAHQIQKLTDNEKKNG